MSMFDGWRIILLDWAMNEQKIWESKKAMTIQKKICLFTLVIYDYVTGQDYALLTMTMIVDGP